MGLSGADIEYQRLLRGSGAISPIGMDGARLFQSEAENPASSEVSVNIMRNGSYAYLTSGVSNPVRGLSIVVPPSNTSVDIEWYIVLTIGNTGSFVIQSVLYETTLGALIPTGYSYETYGSDVPTVTMGPKHHGKARLDPSTDYRMFGLSFTFVKANAADTRSVATYCPDVLQGSYIKATKS